MTARKKVGRQFVRGEPNPGFKLGESGNPGGRPSKKAFRDFFAEKGPDGLPRMENVYRAWYMTAIDRKHRDHMAAVTLIVAHDIGKPVESTELSGPGGGALPIKTVVDGVIEKIRRAAGAETTEG